MATGTGAAFGTDYSHDGSRFKVAIECLDNSSGQGTVLSDPIRMATHELETYGRAEATKAIIVLSDGKPTNSASASVRSFSNYCEESYLAAEAAKTKGIEVFTVGFGLDGANDDVCSDTASPWTGVMASDLLAAMATGLGQRRLSCQRERRDSDHILCLPKTPGHSPELSYAFEPAATQADLLQPPGAHRPLKLVSVPQPRDAW